MDYVYNFSATERNAIDLHDDAVVWPKLNNDVDTVLLRVNITKNKWSKFVRPYIEITSNNHSERQYLERDCLGIRYLNITSFNDTDQKISLRSNILQWEQQAEVIAFANNINPKAKVLVIAPHPDDAELAAFGFYSDHDSHIINITVGETGRIDYAKKYFADEKQQRLFKAKVRVLDSITTPLWGGVKPQNVYNLGYFSSSLQEMYQNPDQEVVDQYTNTADISKWRKMNIAKLPKSDDKATWNNLLNDLKTLIAKIKPDIIVMPHPALDKNPDHNICTQAVFAAMQDIEHEPAKLMFYVAHSNVSAKYPFGPQHSPVTVPPNFVDTQSYAVYSHKLSYEKQVDKLFALNNMHDIAPVPGGGSIWQQLWHKFFGRSKYYKPWQKYFRKAVRANEMFLVAKIP